MSGTDPESNLSPGEIENLERLETVVQHGLSTYVGVRKALEEIREQQLYRATTSTFEEYLHQRWGEDIRDAGPLQHAPDGEPPTSTEQPGQRPAIHTTPGADLAKACEQTLSALDGDESVDVEIRIAVRKQQDSTELGDSPASRPSSLADLVDEELVPRMRWLLTQASGTIAEVAHHLEARAAEIGYGARADLRDDLLVLDEELARVEALLVGPLDWDSSFTRLLKGEIPPLHSNDDSQHDDDG